MKFRFTVFLAFIFILSSFAAVSAQIDSAIAQITSSATTESFVGGMSGNGRFVVFESRGDHDTQRSRNADGNLEIFLFDYAQRRIFQITDTKSLLVDAAMPPTASENIKVAVVNTRPVISNDGKWLAFGSNATCNFPGTMTLPVITNGGNPGNFNPNTLAACTVGTGQNAMNNLPNDGNTEMWFYRIPDVAPADLSLGLELPLTDLSAGTFVQATNTLPSRPTAPGTTTTAPVIADDNRTPAINDDGGYVAFKSNRDLEPCPTTPSNTCGNASPNFNNDEIFLAILTGTNPNFTVTNKQITATPKGSIQVPIINDNPAISGNGLRIAFFSTANNPVVGMTGGSNTDNSGEIFYTDIVAGSGTTVNQRQVTQTSATPGAIVNTFSYGKRMSRDGRYIAFDSFAELETANSPVQTSFATYLFDTMPPMSAASFIKVLPRSTADSAATGGDLPRFPTFTDYTGLEPGTLVFETRLNITSTGTIPSNAADGLNPNPARPAQIYSSPLSTIRAAQTFTRLTELPTPFSVLAVIQPVTGDSVRRISFNMSRTEPGTGNLDLLAEAFYLLTPVQTQQTASALNFATGASRIPVVPSPVPTPSPTATPTPTPSPSPSPSASPTPTVTPTPQTPPAVQGVSPGMLAIVDFTTGFNQPVAAMTAVGSLQRRFTLPIELGGVTMTINGAACGLKMVSRRQIIFVVPPAIDPSTTPYEVVINNNGVVMKGTVVIVPARPDVFTFNEVPGPGGRARIFNATNRVLTREPFNVTTLRYRGGRRVPTVLRLYLTGVEPLFGVAFAYNVRINGVSVPPSNVSPAVLREPGVHSIDITLPPELDMAGEVPIIVQVITGGVTYSARLDDTAPVFRIL